MTSAVTSQRPSGTGDYAFDWALVDVETSGLRPYQDRVLSVAVVTIGPDGERTGEFSTLLNPGCDPGPVHVHGLTAERLRGAPTFDQVAGRIGAMLQDRVMVAHNAPFDYDFLAHEFARARLWLPVTQRLCTLALNRRVGPPTDDLRLGTLAAHYGVRQVRAHDALDDVRVLSGILRGSLDAAARLDLPLPLVPCPPRQGTPIALNPPKTPCAFRNPGRMSQNGPLQQGMKVAITGDTAVSRPELVARAVSACLNVMTSVTRHTSVLVANDRNADSAKLRRAAAEGVPVIDEHTFLQLLTDVRAGAEHTAGSAPAMDAPSAPEARLRSQRPAAPQSPARVLPDRSGSRPLTALPLTARRVLVLGGAHIDAAEVRSRVVALGGAAAVNLSARVTDVVLLPGGESDRRMARITALGLAVHELGWLDAPAAGPAPAEAGLSAACLVLPRGGVTDLADTRDVPRWTVTATWAQRTSAEIDVVAFVLDENGQVRADEDFVFYGAPESPDGSLRLAIDGPAEQAVAVDLSLLPTTVRTVAIAAAIDRTSTFGDVGAVEITAARDRSAEPFVQATLDAATTERTLLLAEIYRRGPRWRLRAIGQGYDHGLDTLARDYGVDIED
ncbi:DNA polymerase-3 subunit epsilon [Actinacidiphila yanglinensis]|uniref:DNA polymerase-3 subunit epsilon n=1 Tax=Actinacidiphila yanglinensis TaxID=310779 RepID=A0A1H6DEM8_9ACTN|nr:TerD family protein [Actinacidiphila yanglinensis]SEG83173.1 DNA polymerase-3 subunit epsilon [Actinacidiphila yanglinensis]